MEYGDGGECLWGVGVEEEKDENKLKRRKKDCIKNT